MWRRAASGLVALALFRAALGTSAAEEPRYESKVLASEDELPPERATSTVSRSDMDRRLPRSAPDALRYEPGVFVQQTAHGQGSAFIRGLTGQQTLILFDGIRLNNSTYRQGPNQYFFTLDSRTLASIEVLRGGGSTRFGSDALGGVIAAHPVEPPPVGPRLQLEPRLFFRGATADGEVGGRAQVGLSRLLPGGRELRFFGGVGVRRAGLLQSGGAVENPNPNTPLGRLPWVPRFAPDGRTQLGTGFRELTADGRLVVRLHPKHTVTAAAYLYRQYDAPRTDQCPAPTALFDTCLTYDEQFRHLVYVAWDGDLGVAAREARVTLSWQQQHERRRSDQPQQFTQQIGTDDVHTLGLIAQATTARWRPRPTLALSLTWGLDNYLDLVRSAAFLRYSDVNIVSPISRGQYLDRSWYLYGGAFADGELAFRRKLFVRAGARLSWTAAGAPGDPQSGSKPVDAAWVPVVGHAGVEWRIHDAVHALVNIDHSFRAPNLDDLTSRQQTGPGFQFENARLGPERATTFEAGLRVRTQRFVADVWVFETLLHDAILKQPKTAADCPSDTPQCNSSWSRFQLTNAPGLSEVRGVEASGRLKLGDFTLRVTLTYTWGEGPKIGALPSGLNVSLSDRVPLSRIPPLNGTVEAGYTHRWGFSVGAAIRWAALQDRLALVDYSDGRIPRYGTPGFIVCDLRAAYRLGSRLVAALVFENVFDAAYRYHGSSVNGPGRGLMLSLEALLF